MCLQLKKNIVQPLNEWTAFQARFDPMDPFKDTKPYEKEDQVLSSRNYVLCKEGLLQALYNNPITKNDD